MAASPAAAAPDDAGADAAPGDASAAIDTGTAAEAGADATGLAVDASPDAAEPADGALGPSSYVMDDGSVPSYSGGDIFQRLCVENPNPPTFLFTSVPAPYATPAACKTFISEHAAARSCLCEMTNCFALQQQCDALPGCREIQKCGFDTGCHDANGCYLISGLCVAPIDKWGTGSVATALSQMLETCGQSHSCPIQ